MADRKIFEEGVKEIPDIEPVYAGKYRPQFNYSPQMNWMNDPNGLMYNATTGEYHMFYQHNPYSINWGYMSWGHAVSLDLVHWVEKPVAIFHDEFGTKFSGSGVVDYKNTTGFFDDDIPPESRLVAVVMNSETSEPGLMLSYTLDDGETWIKYQAGRTVLKDVGDPKVIWYEDKSMDNGGCWLLITTQVGLWTSPDLKNWTFNSMVQLKDGTDFGTWECPDIYPLAVDGDEENIKWIYNAAGSFYFIGNITKNEEGKLVFRAESDAMPYNSNSWQWTAPDVHMPQSGDGLAYATQTFFNDPKGRRLAVTWIRESTGTSNDAGKTWNGAQSFPHETTLRTVNGKLRLFSYPIEEIKKLRGNLIYSCSNEIIVPEDRNLLEGRKGRLMDIEGTFTLGADVVEFGIKFRQNADKSQETVVKYEVLSGKFILDQDKSGASYTGICDAMTMKPLEGNKVKIRILADTSVVQAFGNDGEVPITSAFFPDFNSDGLEMYAVGGNVIVDDLKIYSMGSMWEKS